MRRMKQILACLLLITSVCAEETKHFWLAKAISVESDVGIRGYKIGTPIFKEGDKYRVGSDLVALRADFITDDFQKIRQVFEPIRVAPRAATPKPAPKATPRPQTYVPAPRVMTPKEGGLQPANGLNK